MNTADFAQAWTAVYGHPVWSVKKGHGSFLTLEFGSPTLQIIREPRAVSPGISAQVQMQRRRRLVTVTGQWHLWIYCCHWSITWDGSEIAHSESPGNMIESAAEQLDGQLLVSVRRGDKLGAWVFAFDLGGELHTWPYGDDATEEQWFLYERDSGRDRVLAARADGQCSYEMDA